MPNYDELVMDATAAAGKVTEIEDQLEHARAEYRRAVRRLHLAGASMREIAEALGISHQRVHQMLDDGGVRRWRRRRHQDGAPPRTCSFCGREQRQVRKLVAGPGGVYICDPCIMAAVGVSSSGRPAKDPALTIASSDGDLACSFCGKRRADVATLVVGRQSAGSSPPTICDECLGLCGEILSEQLR